MVQILLLAQAYVDLMNGPTTLTDSSDDAFGAYGRDTLYFIIPLMETHLDRLSFWNQGVFQYFLRKVFYNKSDLQCNSVLTYNSRSHDPSQSGSIYPPFGFNPDEIYNLIKNNLNHVGYNPLFAMLDQFRNDTGLSGM